MKKSVYYGCAKNCRSSQDGLERLRRRQAPGEKGAAGHLPQNLRSIIEGNEKKS